MKNKVIKTNIKSKAEPTGMSYHKTAYVGIAKKVLLDGSVRYRVRFGRTFVASGKMTLEKALEYLEEASGRNAVKKKGSRREDIIRLVRRYKIMRRLFKDHEPADLTAHLTFLEEGRAIALPQTGREHAPPRKKQKKTEHNCA